jgi:hypothetical protein
MSQPELFSVPEQDSPRLAWLKLRRVTTKNWPGCSVGDEDEFGNELWPWTAFVGDPRQISPNVGVGGTEDDAIADLARKRGWRMWNEEGF